MEEDEEEEEHSWRERGCPGPRSDQLGRLFLFPFGQSDAAAQENVRGVSCPRSAGDLTCGTAPL
ncbi:hypothetical protein EYF80_031500 [Liparis tanakae]|uniref:Uncharacterized protein n=1 Tax=Liparis tanakae TaxID=230148 RepID=A0A4Z2GYB6_9TELE|nr:hypothetical protein EYF80_031500 [Liparis tanakae]